MRTYENGGILLESIDEFPKLTHSIDRLVLDLETTSGTPKKSSVNPWFHCEILGAAFSFDKSPAYYIPMRHRLSGDESRNLDIEACNEYLRKLISLSAIWINHGIKYDAHVLANSGGVNILDYPIELWDTLTLAKLIDSDRFKYDLSSLSYDVLFEDISTYEEEFTPYLKHPGGNTKNRDYGLIPLDYIAPYACQDVLTEWKLFDSLIDNLESSEVWKTERELTKVLYKTERNGLRLDYTRAMIDNYRTIPDKLQKIRDQLSSVTGRQLQYHKSADCYELIVETYGLPVLEYTDKGEPSFGADALKAYEVYERTTEEQRVAIGLIKEYRKLHKLKTSFVKPYLDLMDHNELRLHCSYNQCVRTGRMSCSMPNMQQLSPEAKEYIIPDEDCCFIDFDLKQIEYRVIAHFIKNPSITKAYLTDPTADYHEKMAELCKIDRKPAKNMNFAVSFGAGKPKTKSMLKEALAYDTVPDDITFDQYCDIQGDKIYKTYHETVPELKTTMWRASSTLRQKGYVRNLFGRIRRLPKRFHFKAFNNVIQSSAADIMKAITLAINECLDEDEKLLAIVHDSWLIQTPIDKRESTVSKIKNVIETIDSHMEIPVYSSSKHSELNWAHCE